jgi:glycosyltransferase involved in cell wall biosynthesis
VPPTVSIVLPTYDRLAYLKEAVQSVLAQTVADWELIVVDDGSTDDTAAWLESLVEPRITVVRQAHTGNRSRLRNLGVERARARWIAFLDSDDLWHPDKLAVQLEQLAANPTRRWSCTGIRFIDGQGAPVPQRSGTPYVAQSGWILEQLLTFKAAATTPTVMVEKSLLDEVGGFDEAFLLREDYELEVRLAARAEILALAEELTVVRHHPGRTSTGKRVADLHGGTALVFRKAAQAAANRRVRALCRGQCARQLVRRARVLSRDGEHGAAFRSVAGAIREAPFAPEVWRSAAGCVLRWLDVRLTRA